MAEALNRDDRYFTAARLHAGAGLPAAAAAAAGRPEFDMVNLSASSHRTP